MATTTTRWNDAPEAAHAERPHSGRRWARLRLRRQAVRGSSQHNYATRRCAMTLPYDDDPKFTAYAHPERLRSEEHTSELQSRFDLVCRLLLEKKNRYNTNSDRAASTTIYQPDKGRAFAG